LDRAVVLLGSCSNPSDGLPSDSTRRNSESAVVLDRLYVVLRSRVGFEFQRVHAEVDYVELERIFIGLELERHERSLPRAD
jgi:hypothetical protein